MSASSASRAFLSAVVLFAPVLAAARAQSTPVPAQSPPTSVKEGSTCRFDLVDNGSFDEKNAEAKLASGVRPIPWWRSSLGMAMVFERSSGVHDLVLREHEWAEQPIAAYGPIASSIEIRGSVGGRGRLVWIDGSGERATFDLASDEGAWRTFTIHAEEAAKQLGHKLVPRFTLRLEPGAKGEESRWRDLHCFVELPCPSESELRAEVLDLTKKIIEPWLTRGLDDVGARKTAFLCHYFDAVTGARVLTGKGGFNPLYENLNDALLAAEVPEWRAALERFLEDFLTLGLAPKTGLPCSWDPEKDVQDLDQPVEIGLAWGFLIDVARSGPEKFRARAKLAAEKIGATVLAHGLLPDGNIGVSYYPADARVNPNVVQLRRFDVIAQLARLTALTGDARYMQAADEALTTFEFTHYWAGSWSGIDPAFDDEYGHYGARAASVALALPEDKLFRRFALDGFEHFAPLWRDAMRLGGNVAADQVRCWKIASELVRIEPPLAPRVGELLSMAARSHFKGEQYGDGAWGDVTIFDFSPISGLAVGDYPGSPQNLLSGLASVYGGDLGLPREEVRAMYTAVLRSSVQAYLRPYGFITDRSDRRGQNLAVGSLRMLLGLTRMLAKLPG